jgi:hypothetical protein
MACHLNQTTTMAEDLPNENPEDTAQQNQQDEDKKEPQQKKDEGSDDHEVIPQPESPRFYLAIALFSFLLSAILFVALAYYSKRLDLILGDRAFYLLLFPLAFSTAAFLFGVLHSWAVYNHTTVNSRLQLGGPVVVALLVIVGAFFLHGHSFFDYTISLDFDAAMKAPAGYPKPESMQLSIKEGSIWVNGNLNGDGDFDFKHLDGSYKNSKVRIKFKSQFWKSSSDSVVLSNDSQTLTIRPDGSLGTINGKVEDQNGIIIPGAKVSYAGIDTTTDKDGNYTLFIPLAKQGQSIKVDASYDEHAGFSNVEPATNVSAVIYLQRYTYHKK